MKLIYTVPRELYIILMEDMIRKRERRPLGMFLYFILTIGQFAGCLLVGFLRMEGKSRYFLLIWSVLLAALTILRRSTVPQRAKGLLMRLEDSGQLPKDFWEKHILQVKKDILQLRYGAQELTCPLAGISRVEERTDAVYIWCGETIFDMVPLTAFHGPEGVKDFIRGLEQLSATTPMPGQAEVPMENSSCISWSIDEKKFLDGQFLAFRTLYYKYRFLRAATFIRLGISVMAVINIMRDLSPVNLAISIVILIVANLENISMIPFICKFRIRRELGAWKGSKQFRLAKQGDAFLFASETTSVRIPLKKIRLYQQTGSDTIIAWSDFPAMVIPTSVTKTEEAIEILKGIKVQ